MSALQEYGSPVLQGVHLAQLVNIKQSYGARKAYPS